MAYGTRTVRASAAQIYYMAAGFLLIIYIKNAPPSGPIDLASCQFMYDGVVKFWNFPIKLGHSAVFSAALVAMFTGPRRLLDVA
jgi:hypothetical protein